MTIPGFDPALGGQRVVFGTDRVHELGEELVRLGRSRPLIVCSWRRHRSQEFRHVAGGLGLTPRVFENVEQHVPWAVVEAADRTVREQEADAVVSFGGGSAVDLGKALVFLSLDEAGESEWRQDRPRGPRTRLAHVAVPTTYSGVQATGRCFVSHGQDKVALAGPDVRPDVAVLDPGLTLRLPWKPTASTGFVALGHCLETSWSPETTPGDRSVAADVALTLMAKVPEAVGRPTNGAVRSDLLAASHTAGMLVDRSGPGVLTALCNATGARAGVAHGVAATILLPSVLRFGEDRGSGDSLVSGATEPLPDAIERLAAALNLPGKLREVGVFEQDLDLIATSLSDEPPRLIGADDALAILRASW